MPKSRQPDHFTCLEGLVVLAVITILAALLLPLVGRARQKAVRVECASRQRQVVAALHVYAGDSNGSFLPTRVYHGRPAITNNHANVVFPFVVQYLRHDYDLLDDPAWTGYLRYQKDLYERGQLPILAGEEDAVVNVGGYLGAAAHQEVRWDAAAGFDPDRLGLDATAIARRFTAPADWPLVVDASTQALSLAGDADRRQPPNWWLIAPHLEDGASYHYAWRGGSGNHAMGELAGANHAYVDGRVVWLRRADLNAVIHESPQRLTWWAAAR